jgi:hypothetical protein
MTCMSHRILASIHYILAPSQLSTLVHCDSDGVHVLLISKIKISESFLTSQVLQFHVLIMENSVSIASNEANKRQ